MYRLPTGPLPKADVSRRERSWVFTAGSRHFAFTRIEYQASTRHDPGRPVVVARGWRPSAIIGTMVALLGGTTLIALAINSTRASAGYRYVVSVPLPPVRHAPRLEAPLLKPVVRATRHVGAPIAPLPVRVDPQIADYTVGELDNAVEPAGANSMSAAIGAAMTTGRLQQWATGDGGERGFVVVGPVESGSSGCRAVSILIRRDGDNQVERRRQCPGDPVTP
jgi:hypothetical protein